MTHFNVDYVIFVPLKMKLLKVDQAMNMESVTIKHQIFVFQVDLALDQGGVLIKVVHLSDMGALDMEGDLWEVNMANIMEVFKGHIFLL